MAVANKLAVLQKIKQEKCVLFGPLSHDLTKRNKCEKWQEVNDLAESLGLAVAVLLRQFVAGANPDFQGPQAYTTFGALFKKKFKIMNIKLSMKLNEKRG